MNAPCRQRPMHNGSSGSTVEVLLGLTVVGASVLTAFALLPRRRRRQEPEQSDGETDQHSEERDDDGA